jgi:hypothetical protein
LGDDHTEDPERLAGKAFRTHTFRSEQMKADAVQPKMRGDGRDQQYQRGGCHEWLKDNAIDDRAETGDERAAHRHFPGQRCGFGNQEYRNKRDERGKCPEPQQRPDDAGAITLRRGFPQLKQQGGRGPEHQKPHRSRDIASFECG